MSEPEVLATQNVEEDAASSAVRAGQLLRQAREAAGVHLEAIAVTLKVHVHTVESLEAGRLDDLLDVVFARGLASSMCRVLKIDPAPVLELLPRKASPELSVGVKPGPAATFRPKDVSSSPSSARRVFGSPSGFIVLLLVVGALALWLLPSFQGADDQETGASTSEPVPATGGLDVTPAVPGAAPASEPVAQVNVPALQPAASPVAVAPAPAVAPVAQASAAAVAAQAAASKPAVAAAPTASAANTVVAVQPASTGEGGVLSITAKAASWVRVTDAAGVMSINRTLQPGETVQAGGAAPLSVVVGAADAVQVAVRGQAYDLTPVTRVNVARFEVK